MPVLGAPVSASTVSRVAKTLDAAVAAFHARPLGDRYRVLMLDGVVLARKTGAGSLRRPVLVALGLRPDARKEIIDFRLARAGIGGWIDYYNTSRPHSVFDGRTPEEVYTGRDAPSSGHAPEMAPEALAA